MSKIFVNILISSPFSSKVKISLYELLFTFLSLRAERKSTIITTNLSFDRWNEIFNDAVLTAALIDRMTHKSYVINMNGDSYRIKETREWLENTN
ncbi:ATP-binding protein [Anaerosalibacter massiliensis]|uniref:ATP-binding protein n=1 Tax=Anaerosalibacter massiliensis TaxID=1347392 RepID=UPI002795E38E|nr:ATP-binding protein [Anaerosalibacter massiliensis]